MGFHSGRYRVVAHTSLECSSRGGTLKEFLRKGSEKYWGGFFFLILCSQVIKTAI